ncbi:hypothetical protein TIFTF001_035290 [Ficus carica]|uniref:Uncharacterized protein n=1 Tax=Ficus carica TaxID=3494 RepID=A0AA88E4I4_FICCA|nr:hypothetical protein TIFTF001_035290 [Ficus carica]
MYVFLFPAVFLSFHRPKGSRAGGGIPKAMRPFFPFLLSLFLPLSSPTVSLSSPLSLSRVANWRSQQDGESWLDVLPATNLGLGDLCWLKDVATVPRRTRLTSHFFSGNDCWETGLPLRRHGVAATLLSVAHASDFAGIEISFAIPTVASELLVEIVKVVSSSDGAESSLVITTTTM